MLGSPAIILGLLLVLSVETAQAEGIRPEPFFDFGFAKNVWKTFSYKRFHDYLVNECPQGGPDDIWKEAYRRNPQKALEELKTNPDRGKIKRCYDFQLVYDQWGKIYVTWRYDSSGFGGKGWNKNEPNLLCMSMGAQNIFTHKCNDLPDWRRPEWRKKDEAAMADYNARSAAADAERNKTPAERQAEHKALMRAEFKKYGIGK